MANIVQHLQQLLPAESIKTSLIDRLSYASDAGFYQLIPQAVVLPATEQEIAALFALSHQHKVPLVFRAAGTSLSGQSITDGILVDISRYWRKIKLLDSGAAVLVQPGVTGGIVNHFLKKHAAKIGPDPASIQAAMMGGILSNNASGMCCGVAYNSYHTLKALRFMMPDGKVYDTRNPNDYNRFVAEQSAVGNRLTLLRKQVLENDTLHDRIRHKYQTKNTVGYSLNALIDFEHPLDIFSHLLIGAEGTLAFISEAELHTIPDKPFKAAAMLYFPGIYEACASIVALKECGAEALELMDRASLRSVEHLPGLPDFFKSLPDGAAALLCEFQANSPQSLAALVAKASALLQSLPLLHAASFTTDEAERTFYWKLRKGMFPSVGAVRKRGTTVILEDVAFPIQRLADALVDLQQLFTKYGYDNAIIFGHAKDGNIHFVITQLLDTAAEVQRYDTFLREVVDLVLKKYDGTLKGEHGTGRNMAPFVEAEWGGEAFSIMQQIKAVADPMGLLNPGVIINSSATAHIEHLKDLPQVEEEVDKCIECGFCEVNCPSRDVTMTPRRRIVARRALQRLKKEGRAEAIKELLKEYDYDGLDTCATDGLCATDCPVDINTGELVKRLRHEQHGAWANKIAAAISNNYKAVEKLARRGIGFIAWIDNIAGWQLITRFTGGLHRLIPSMPVWLHQVKGARTLPQTNQHNADYLFFTSCINRVMENNPPQEKSLQETLLSLSQKAGINLVIPGNIAGFCCGQPFSSKGFFEAGISLLERTIDQLLVWTNDGKVPVLCDFSSCTYTFLQNAKRLSPTYQQRFSKLNFVDSVAFIHDIILPRIKLRHTDEKVVLHPTCAVTKMKLNHSLAGIANAISSDVLVPAHAGCCGMAGDRGFLVPELTAGAVRQELDEVKALDTDACYASATTCEISLSHLAGKQYKHIAYLVDAMS